MDDLEKLTISQIEKWANDFDSWDICDQTHMNLFSRSKAARKKNSKFAKSKEEFIKRTAFALMAALAVHGKDLEDRYFIEFFSLIKKAARHCGWDNLHLLAEIKHQQISAGRLPDSSVFRRAVALQRLPGRLWRRPGPDGR